MQMVISISDSGWQGSKEKAEYFEIPHHYEIAIEKMMGITYNQAIRKRGL